MRYPAIIEIDSDGCSASFPDIPEALTCADTLEDAINMAHDALATAVEFYFEDRRPVPMPSKPKTGQFLINLPATLSAKVLLLNELLRQGVRPGELATKMKVMKQDVNRILNPRHATKIDTLEEAFQALGMDLEMKLVRRANPRKG